MKTRYLSALFSVLVILSACQVLGTPTPKSYNERLAAGYTTLIAVRTTATSLLQSNFISADDAQHIQDTADKARTGLDLARTFGQTPRGEDKLTSTLIILTELQKYLAARSPK